VNSTENKKGSIMK